MVRRLCRCLAAVLMRGFGRRWFVPSAKGEGGESEQGARVGRFRGGYLAFEYPLLMPGCIPYTGFGGFLVPMPAPVHGIINNWFSRARDDAELFPHDRQEWRRVRRYMEMGFRRGVGFHSLTQSPSSCPRTAGGGGARWQWGAMHAGIT